MFITRFAPSPTGPLHLGHAYSAILAYDRAQAEAGTFLLRIDDLDQTRCRSEWEVQIFDDLAWLGLGWPRPVLRQSTRLPRYRAALKSLWNQGLIYQCSCSRADIRAATSAPQEGAPLLGPDGVIYPGTCRPATPPQGPMPEECALRLDMARACRMLSNPLIYKEKDRIITPHNLPHTVGDVVLARREMGASYHLSVVVDDADQGITHVIRGEDLQEATQIHVLLQRLLGLPTPAYHHHALMRDAAGRRLAKRDDARAIATYRADGASPSDIRALLGL
jgi:glutamyl-Q tRNA(Asp) synthetase